MHTRVAVPTASVLLVGGLLLPVPAGATAPAAPPASQPSTVRTTRASTPGGRSGVVAPQTGIAASPAGLAPLRTPEGRPVVVAHRGASAEAPENTLAAV